MSDQTGTEQLFTIVEARKEEANTDTGKVIGIHDTSDGTYPDQFESEHKVTKASNEAVLSTDESDQISVFIEVSSQTVFVESFAKPEPNEWDNTSVNDFLSLTNVTVDTMNQAVGSFVPIKLSSNNDWEINFYGMSETETTPSNRRRDYSILAVAVLLANIGGIWLGSVGLNILATITGVFLLLMTESTARVMEVNNDE